MNRCNVKLQHMIIQKQKEGTKTIQVPFLYFLYFLFICSLHLHCRFLPLVNPLKSQSLVCLPTWFMLATLWAFIMAKLGDGLRVEDRDLEWDRDLDTLESTERSILVLFFDEEDIIVLLPVLE